MSDFLDKVGLCECAECKLLRLADATDAPPVTGEDKGAERETRPPKPCLARLEVNGWLCWCLRADGHEGPHSHSGVAP